MRLSKRAVVAVALYVVYLACPITAVADCAAGDGNITSPGLCTTPQNLTAASGTVVAGATLSTGSGTTAYTISSNNSSVTNAGSITSAGLQAVLMNGSGSATLNGFTAGGFTSTLSNSGLITAPQGTAIVVKDGQVLNVTNTGTITAGNGTALDYGRSPFQSFGTINQAAGTINGEIFFAGQLNITGGAINGPIVGATTIPSGGAGSSFNTSNLGSVKFDLGSGSFTTGGVLNVASVNVLSGTVVLAHDVVNRLGNSGTLRISGTRTIGGFTQNSSGTLVMPITPQGASQLVVPSGRSGINRIPGSATLAGTLALEYAPGAYTARSYTLISVGGVNGQSGNLTGGFSTITGNVPTPGLTQSIVLGPDFVDLVLSSIRPDNATVFSAGTTAAVLNGQRINTLLLDRWGPGAAMPPPLAAQSRIHTASATPSQLADALGAALPDAVARYGGWFRGLGSFASLDAGAGAPGLTAQTGGFLAGLDRPVGEDTWLGGAIGYSHTDFAEKAGGSGSIETGRLAMYGGTLLGPAVLTGTVGYAYDWIDTERPIAGSPTAHAGHAGNEIIAAAQLALPFEADGIRVTPKFGLQFVHLAEDAFADSGSSALSAGDHSTDSLQPFIGASLGRPFLTDAGMVITPEVRFGYNREVLSNSRVVNVTTGTGTILPIAGVRPSKDVLTAGAGLAIRDSEAVTLYARYDAILHTGNTSDHTVSAGVRIRF